MRRRDVLVVPLATRTTVATSLNVSASLFRANKKGACLYTARLVLSCVSQCVPLCSSTVCGSAPIVRELEDAEKILKLPRTFENKKENFFA